MRNFYFLWKSQLLSINNTQGLYKSNPTFNTALSLQTSDNQALHVGQVLTIASTGIAIGNPDARYTLEDSKLYVPTISQDGGAVVSVTLQLTTPGKSELTVLDVSSSASTGTAGGLPAGSAPGEMLYTGTVPNGLQFQQAAMALIWFSVMVNQRGKPAKPHLLPRQHRSGLIKLVVSGRAVG